MNLNDVMILIYVKTRYAEYDSVTIAGIWLAMFLLFALIGLTTYELLINN